VIIPPGAMLLLNGFKPLINQFSFMFSMSFIIASPMIIALVTIDFCSALITRTMPQVNTYFFTLPIKIILGLAMLSMMLPYLAPITDRIMEECFHAWQEFMV
jgi:flagellar biosynthetic protein FliR